MHLDVDGVALFVHEFGAGDPMILLPPGPGLDGSAFFPWFERLEGHRLLAVDLTGHGRSDHGDPDRWTVVDWAALVARLAETMGLDDYTLLGHSFGARLALQHAVDHPGHAARVVCSGGVAHAGALAHLDETFASFGTPELRASVEAAFEAEETVETSDDCHAAWMGQMPFFLAEPNGPALAELERSWRSIRYSPELHRHGSFGEYDVRPSLPGVSVPVLVITGREDRITRPAESEEIAALLPEATLAIVDGAGHFPFAEQPDAYFAAVGAWLNRE
jgi:pimeloyl-ACP methyl ester carboxylesterase